MKKKHFLLFLLFTCLHSYSQESKTLKKLDKELQKCLDDTQNNMMNCSFEYYTKIDDLLNVTYKNIRSQLNKPEQEKLKQQQLAWLKKRDKYFKEVQTETAKELDGDNSSQDYRMICAHEYAVYVKDKILELEKTYSKNI